MKTFFGLKQSLIIMIALVLGACSGGGNNGPDKPPADLPLTSSKTTLMVYSVVSNLSAGTDDLLNELRSVGSTQDFNIVVQTGGGSGGYRDNSRFRISNQGGFEALPVRATSLMTTTAELEDFVNAAITRFPANHYHLILVNHGGLGVYGQDDRDPSRQLSPQDIASVIKRTGIKLDLLGLDTCLLATSIVAQEMAGAAKVLLASEEIGWSGGYSNWDFGQLRNLKTSPGATVAVAKALADSYIARAPSVGLRKTISVIDLAKAQSYFSRYEELLNRLTTLLTADAAGNEVKKRIANARKRSYPFGSFLDQNFRYDVDVRQFLELLRAENIGASTNSLIDSTLSEYASAVLYSRNALVPSATGLSMVVPAFTSKGSISGTINTASAMVTGSASRPFLAKYGAIVSSFATPVSATERTTVVASGTGGCIVGVTCKPGQIIVSAKDGVLLGSVELPDEIASVSAYLQTAEGILLQSRDLPLDGTDFRYQYDGQTYKVNGLDTFASVGQPDTGDARAVRLSLYIDGKPYVGLLLDNGRDQLAITSLSRLPEAGEKLLSPLMMPGQVIGSGARVQGTRAQLNDADGTLSYVVSGPGVQTNSLSVQRVANNSAVSGFVRILSTSGEHSDTQLLRLK
ncbi:clostripain-related cysteine peptidase [Pseudoduganella sp. HUAS MS19]